MKKRYILIMVILFGIFIMARSAFGMEHDAMFNNLLHMTGNPSNYLQSSRFLVNSVFAENIPVLSKKSGEVGIPAKIHRRNRAKPIFCEPFKHSPEVKCEHIENQPGIDLSIYPFAVSFSDVYKAACLLTLPEEELVSEIGNNSGAIDYMKTIDLITEPVWCNQMESSYEIDNDIWYTNYPQWLELTFGPKENDKQCAKVANIPVSHKGNKITKKSKKDNVRK